MNAGECRLTAEDDIFSSSSAPAGGNGSGGVGVPATARVIVRSRSQNSFVSRRIILILGLLVIFALGAILVSLALHWYYSVYRDGELRLTYNHERMAGLQPKVISRVKQLWETANRSIHDPDAREFLRNLSRTDRSTCYSALCVHTALNLLESMDWKHDPCSDFYTFTCGGWIIKNPSESTASVTDHFAKINDRVVQATQRIIEKTNPNGSSKGLELARSLYFECSDIDQLERNGLSNLIKILEANGGWPLLYGHALGDTWTNRWSFNWLEVAALLQTLSIPTILSLEIKQDMSKPQTNALYVIEPLFFISREFLIEPDKNAKLLTAYKQFIIETAIELVRWKNHQPDSIRLDDAAQGIIMFEVSLAKLVKPETTVANLETFWSISLLQEETDKHHSGSHIQNKILWEDFINMVFDGSEVNITSKEKILVHDMNYIKGLSKLLDNTSTETIANYLLWRLMVKFTTGSTKALRKIHAKFYENLYGEQKLMDRKSNCAMVINNKFAIAIGAEFIKDSFESSLKREVESLATNLKVRMEELLGRQSFIPHLLQLGIRRKLSSIKTCVGFPRTFSNSSYVSNFYQDLDYETIGNATYIEKYMHISKWLFLKSLSVLKQPFDTSCWGGNYWGGNFIGEAYAYYDTARNSINLPVGLLQTPFYYQRPSVPMYLNYGGIGTIVGHELTHSLNIEGWIRVKLVRELEKLWECLISSYSETDITELEGKSKVDGYRTRSENFADHFGLASAYWAYQQRIKSTKNNINEIEEQSLPGLEFFSSSQMFFISFANMWCDSKSKESLYDEAVSSSHTPSKYRVLGALKHSKDFSNVWSCSPDSKMNPRQKCNLF